MIAQIDLGVRASKLDKVAPRQNQTGFELRPQDIVALVP